MNKTLLLISLLAFAPGCGALQTEESDDPELAGSADGKADSLSSTSTYYSFVRDTRKCAFPMCGGYFVSRVNRATTTCHDGSRAAACYVVNLDVENTLGLDAAEAAAFRLAIDEGHALLRGSIKPATYGARQLGFFVPKEGYTAATAAAPAGTFYRLSDSGLGCFRSPCPSIHAAKLNSTLSANLARLDLAGAGATAAQLAQAFVELGNKDLIVAGTLSPPRGLEANQLYLRVRHVACSGLAAYPTPPKALLEGAWHNDQRDADVVPAIYPRTYQINNDSTFAVADAVAPCPPGAVCFWSGIVTAGGTWSVVDDTVQLAYGATSDNGFNIAYQKELKIQKDCAGKIVLSEVRNDGSGIVRDYRP